MQQQIDTFVEHVVQVNQVKAGFRFRLQGTFVSKDLVCEHEVPAAGAEAETPELRVVRCELHRLDLLRRDFKSVCCCCLKDESLRI